MIYKQLLDKVFRDKQGKVAVLQFPNTFLLAWIIASALARVLRNPWSDISAYVAFVAIIAWAGLEILTGTSLFRRMLGVVVLGVSIINRF